MVCESPMPVNVVCLLNDRAKNTSAGEEYCTFSTSVPKSLHHEIHVGLWTVHRSGLPSESVCMSYEQGEWGKYLIVSGMNSSIVQLLAFEKLNGNNYTAWKSNLKTILVVDDLRFVLTEECPQTPPSNANRASQEAYDQWIKAEKGSQKNSSWKKLSEARSLSKLELEKWSQLKQIERLVKSRLLNQLEDNSLPPCDSCLEGKTNKISFTGKGLRAQTLLELVHSDHCGPMNVKAQGGYEYFISFIDDYSRYGHVYLIQNKSDSFEKFKECETEVENESSYSKESRGGLFYNPQENEVFVSTNATFLEEDHIRNHQTRIKLVLEEISKNATDRPSSSTKVVDKTRNIGQTHPSQELEEPRCSGRVVRQPDRYLGLSEAQIIIPDDRIEDPLTFKQEMNDVDSDQWIKAMDLEMESTYSNFVWTLVDQPNDVKPIGCKWIYRRKRDKAGKVQTFKARLVAKGYTQKKGIDYEETFSPVAMIKSIRILLSIATFYHYEICQMDVKTAFLNGNLKESFYMVQPERFIQKGQEQKNVDEPCVYKRIINSTVAFLVLYVDDILLIGNDVGHLTDIKEWLPMQFQMKDLGNAQYVLGIQIVRNRKNKTLTMTQTS
ncbi:gag/pol protein [Cucumis melo var. makuwa]|uniref:Gag/pol protein n=1 Tax=Cucumis melo var. makuwa TaxID=1194695 RepID=A0A5A7SLY2_CUCMM|nr:gag/pol protein [Cucumis melo var. makuwa]TYK16862.1 gag/pol protein [Cucumis melo var. makuwa]